MVRGTTRVTTESVIDHGDRGHQSSTISKLSVFNYQHTRKKKNKKKTTTGNYVSYQLNSDNRIVGHAC